ncbi:hypothetical protein D3Z58_15350 [Clostridiaceae bacterium]|nr:hypothetical protein [Clostridiaceae bacterium]
MIKKLLYLYLIIVIMILIPSIITFKIVNIMIEQREEKAKEEELRDRLLKDITYVYEQQLSEDTQLQEEVERFTSDKNMKEMFWKYKEKIQILEDICYKSMKGFYIYYTEDIEGVMFYKFANYWQLESIIFDKRWTKIVGDANYDVVTDFMDDAIENGFAFRYWMLKIIVPCSIQERGRSNPIPRLEIIVYEDKEQRVSYIYFPWKGMDLLQNISNEDIGIANEKNVKIVRINSCWYFKCVRKNES